MRFVTKKPANLGFKNFRVNVTYTTLLKLKFSWQKDTQSACSYATSDLWKSRLGAESLLFATVILPLTLIEFFSRFSTPDLTKLDNALKSEF